MKKLILIALIALMCVVFLAGCSNTGDVKPVDLGIEYVIFYVNEMPCMWQRVIAPQRVAVCPVTGQGISRVSDVKSY